MKYKKWVQTGIVMVCLGIVLCALEYIKYHRENFFNTANMEQYIAEKQSGTVQKEIADEILRFHVIANSDSQMDQELKLKVKDQVVSYLKEELKGADTLETAEMIVENRLHTLEEIAEEVILEEGFDYSVTASVGMQFFPVKVYGDLAFPAGEYQALQVKIGKATGKNWWCVLFPSLCFVDGTYSVVPEESKEELETVIGEENYKTLLTTEEDLSKQQDGKTEIHFKIADWFQKGKKELGVH